MILLTIAIIGSILFLIVEIPAYIRFHNEEDFLLTVISGAMLVASIAVLFVWRVT